MPEIALVEPEIPQNTGNIGRTCVGLGWKLWLVRPFGFELSDKYLRRAGLDYWQHLDFEILESMDAMMERFADRRMWYFSKKAERIYTEVAYDADDILVFGKETKGLPDDFLADHADQSIRIPLRPEARSLNLATAVAIGGYEVVRQLGLPVD